MRENSRAPEIGGGHSHKRKQILLIGTSNTRYLKARFIAGRINYYIRKITKYTVEEAKTFIENYDLDFAPELIVYQLGVMILKAKMTACPNLLIRWMTWCPLPILGSLA